MLTGQWINVGYMLHVCDSQNLKKNSDFNSERLCVVLKCRIHSYGLYSYFKLLIKSELLIHYHIFESRYKKLAIEPEVEPRLALLTQQIPRIILLDYFLFQIWYWATGLHYYYLNYWYFNLHTKRIEALKDSSQACCNKFIIHFKNNYSFFKKIYQQHS